ncbi:MAG TPA: amino acid permease [Rugosimonospora sp.]|jgi:amino acid transporter
MSEAPATGNQPPLAPDLPPPRMPTEVPETLRYRLKRRLLGPPLTTASLHSERLSRPLALGVLAPDCISSSAYGTEEILIELLPVFGLLSFTLLLPITGIILFILVLLTLSYRQVVQVYTRAGGSYVVARENFGPRVAQIAAVALLIDYVVTVAVQSAAGTVAVVSALPALGPYSVEITVGVVVLLAYGNLRGIREAGRAFALPTYLFSAAVGAIIIAGLIRAALGTLGRYDAPALSGAIPVHHETGLVTFALILTLLRAFANGGSSLTGLEAISNGVSAFRPPEGVNARKVLVTMAVTLGFLVAGVSLLARLTHATPYRSGYPSVISQEARIVAGHGTIGTVIYGAVQAASALILYTGANTSFNGFPFLASFVAEDSFLPRQLTRRGHRLVFSDGILLLASISIVLLIVTRAKVNSLVPFYAIGVFTGFTMAGFGMAKYHRTQRGRGWHGKMAINAAAGGLSLLVVLIFAVAKFTEGAWLIVVVFPILFLVLIRVNRRYRDEAAALAALGPVIDSGPNPARHVIVVLVDDLDLAVLRAVRYARTLRPNTLYAVHFVVDNVRAARLAERWCSMQRGDVPLQLRDCPDRRLRRAATELTSQLTADGRTEVTVVLPRRAYGLAARVLHAHSADRIAAAVSRVPHAAATIVPFDVDAAIHKLQQLPEAQGPKPPPGRDGRPKRHGHHAKDATPAAQLRPHQRQDAEGVIQSIEVHPNGSGHLLRCEVVDDTGSFLILFYGRTHIPGITPGQAIRVHGTVGRYDSEPAIANPRYELLPSD